MNALRETNFDLPGQAAFYRGKVRDVYTLEDGRLVMVASDRISAFDVVLPRGIPFKGQVLNQVAEHMLNATADICPNWKQACPDPNVMVGLACEPYRVEMVIRGYLTGHAWRVYRDGGRVLCGVPLPDGLKEHDRLPEPIITPGHHQAWSHIRRRSSRDREQHENRVKHVPPFSSKIGGMQGRCWSHISIRLNLWHGSVPDRFCLGNP